MPDTFPVIELFGPTIQGEGALCGQTSHFVRFGGCTYRCSWCDSMHAVDPDLIHEHATHYEGWRIAQTVQAKLGGAKTAEWVTLSGGDPVMWELEELVRHLNSVNLKVAVETQGAHWRDWLRFCDQVTCSPKPPSSGMASRTDYEILDKYAERLVFHTSHPKAKLALNFKVVVFDENDLDFAKFIHKRYPNVPFYISCGTVQKQVIGNRSPFMMTTEIMEKYRWLVDTVLEDPELKRATVLPQLHAMIWGSKKGV